MLDATFTSVLNVTETSASQLTVGGYLACSLASLLLGLAVAAIYLFRHDHARTFVITLALLPLIVQTVIMLVNGNLGVGVAVMGVFGLVRFRSVAGSAKDIVSVFLAMAIGLATGMGYLTLAVIFTLIVGVANAVYMLAPARDRKDAADKGDRDYLLRVTVPEDFATDGFLDDVLARHASRHRLVEAKTSNMGSLYQLTYEVRPNDPAAAKALIDDVRTRNGNLRVALGVAPTPKERETL